MRNEASVIAITMGCPVGVGPEIIVRYFAAGKLPAGSKVVVLGDPGVMERAVGLVGGTMPVRPWLPGSEPAAAAINVLPLSDLGRQLAWGKPSIATGAAMARYIEEAVRLIERRQVNAMVTCPINKAALHAAGYDYPGHTEMLARLCKAGEYGMMMAGARLRVTLVTIHMALRQVPSALDPESVLRMIDLTARALVRDFGIAAPRLAVAGLNPHAGEEGAFGCEEEQLIAPAVAAARARGWLIDGPFPPDTVFGKAVAGDYDAVVCMYHDQGLIPFKLLHFEDGVNFTMGLPIVRTSVDHGTAYDIAGRGVASAASLAAAVELAAGVVANRRDFAARHNKAD